MSEGDAPTEIDGQPLTGRESRLWRQAGGGRPGWAAVQRERHAKQQRATRAGAAVLDAFGYMGLGGHMVIFRLMLRLGAITRPAAAGLADVVVKVSSETCELFRGLALEVLGREVPMHLATKDEQLAIAINLLERIERENADDDEPDFPEGWRDAVAAARHARDVAAAMEARES